MAGTQHALYWETEEVVDMGTAGLAEENAPPGCWLGQRAGDSSRTRAHGQCSES